MVTNLRFVTCGVYLRQSKWGIKPLAVKSLTLQPGQILACTRQFFESFEGKILTANGLNTIFYVLSDKNHVVIKICNLSHVYLRHIKNVGFKPLILTLQWTNMACKVSFSSFEARNNDS